MNNRINQFVCWLYREPPGFDLTAHLSRSQERETKFAGKPMDLIAHITRAIEVGDIRRVFAKYAAGSGL